MSAAASLAVDDLVVEFVTEGYTVRPLDGLGFEVAAGELAVLLGPSGCGKTTLLSCLGGLLTPTSGTIRLGDLEVTAHAARNLAEYRRTTVGFVFQAFNLIPSLSALENVAMPLLLTGTSRKVAFQRAQDLLDEVGLADRANHRPSQLSGGQQQRVAVARGLVSDPALLLADEPTANLDHIQAENVISLLRDLRASGRIIIVSTHDSRLVPVADRVIEMVPDHEPVPIVEREQHLGAGETLFRQGDDPDHVYLVADGELVVVRENADGTETQLAVVGPGRYVGELGPLLGFPRSATVRATADTTLRLLTIREFRQHAQSD